MPNDEKSYDMLNDSDRQEAIRIKKMKRGLIPDTENEKYEQEKAIREAAPVSFKEKCINFWYHYKWTVFVVGFLAVAATFLTIQGINRKEYDTTVMLCCYTYYDDESLSQIANGFAEYVTDIDGDGKISIGVFQANYKADEEGGFTGFETALQSRIMSEIASGKNCIFVLEKELLDTLAEKGVFADLRELISAEGDSEVYGISLKDSALLDGKSFDKARDNYYLAVRVFKEGGSREAYDLQVDAVKKLYQDITK